MQYSKHLPSPLILCILCCLIKNKSGSQVGVSEQYPNVVSMSRSDEFNSAGFDTLVVSILSIVSLKIAWRSRLITADDSSVISCVSAKFAWFSLSRRSWWSWWVFEFIAVMNICKKISNNSVNLFLESFLTTSWLTKDPARSCFGRKWFWSCNNRHRVEG